MEFDLVVYTSGKQLDEQDMDSIQKAIDELGSNYRRAVEMRDALKEDDYDPEDF